MTIPCESSIKKNYICHISMSYACDTLLCPNNYYESNFKNLKIQSVLTITNIDIPFKGNNQNALWYASILTIML